MLLVGHPFVSLLSSAKSTSLCLAAPRTLPFYTDQDKSITAAAVWVTMLQVWAGLDQLTGRVRQQVPILQKAVAFGVNFFHAGRQ